MAETHRRSSLSLPDRDSSVIDGLDENVTQPLIQCLAIKEYWGQIKDARSKFQSGLIRDVHEFELVLISRNKVITCELKENSTITES